MFIENRLFYLIKTIIYVLNSTKLFMKLLTGFDVKTIINFGYFFVKITSKNQMQLEVIVLNVKYQSFRK